MLDTTGPRLLTTYTERSKLRTLAETLRLIRAPQLEDARRERQQFRTWEWGGSREQKALDRAVDDLADVLHLEITAVGQTLQEDEFDAAATSTAVQVLEDLILRAAWVLDAEVDAYTSALRQVWDATARRQSLRGYEQAALETYVSAVWLLVEAAQERLLHGATCEVCRTARACEEGAILTAHVTQRRAEYERLTQRRWLRPLLADEAARLETLAPAPVAQV